jgi:hypothetical protein
MRAVRPLVRRSLVATVALATVVAAVPALVGQGASAAATADISLSGPTHGAAGSCLMYRVTPTDAFGGAATDTGTVVIRLTESPTSTTQDVDFCVPGTVTSPAISPHYVNAAAAKRFYVPGLTVTDTPTTAKTKTSVADTGTGADNPDVASTVSPVDRANPAGQDTAVYQYDGRSGASTVLTFGVAGLVPGSARIDVFRSGDGDETQSAGDAARSLDVSFTAGGLPGSVEAADAVTSVRATPTQSYSVQGGATHKFAVTLTNSSGDGIAGITPQIRPTSGPNTGSFTASCTRSGNDGSSTCTYSGTNRGTDTIAIWVNQTKARTANPTLGFDSGEANASVTATTTAPVSAARFVDLTPPTASVAQGGSSTFVAAVTDSGGAPVAGVGLTFSETGPGGISGGTTGSGGTSTLTATTDASGRASVTVLTGSTDAGNDAVTATIRTPSSTSCQTVGGRCSDSSTLTVTGSGSPVPTPSPTGPACTTAITGLPEDTVTSTGLATVIVAAARRSTVDLFAYSRPATDYRLVRTGVIGDDGTVSFQIRPATNTRLYAQQRGCTAGSSIVLNVRTALTIAVVRTGVRSYTFSGDSVPARTGGLIVSVYRIAADGTEVLALQARADAQNGEWRVARRFSGSGRFGFVVRTGQDLLNAPGRSNVRSVVVY